jgi:DNA modification methylase
VVTVRVLQGDCRAVLATLPADSVQACITSPPYFGLRSYGTPPQVWGGDPEHVHDWTMGTTRAITGGLTPKQITSPGSYPAPQEHVPCSCGAWLGELGQEPTPELYVAHLVEVFREVRRVLRPDGVLLLNIGDSYAGSGVPGKQSPTTKLARPGDKMAQTYGRAPTPFGYKPKDLLMIPAQVALALRADGWWLRGEYVWSKPAPMPESVTDRCTRSHEYVFHLTKSARYAWFADQIREPLAEEPHAPGNKAKRFDPETASNGHHWNAARMDVAWGNPAGRNKRSVWTIGTAGTDLAHFAVMPPALAETCVRATTSDRGGCPRCGAPWVPVVERGERVRPHRGGKYTDTGANGTNRVAGGAYMAVKPQDVTTGWAPSCRCEAGPPIPQTVLDPFGGAGTTALEADRHGRDAISIELNPAYAEMAERRLVNDAPLFASLERTA